MGRAFLKLLIVENGRDRGAAIAKMAKSAGFEVLLSRPYRGDALPDPQVASSIVLTGGPASVRDLHPTNSAFLSRVLEFTRAAIERWTPTIGICLGHQIIARALNGRVVRMDRMEIGIRRIYPVTAHFAASLGRNWPLQAFVFHQDHVPEPPPGCMATFWSEGCSVEGFHHVERPIQGLQFHPEISGEQASSIVRWWRSDNAETLNVVGDVTAFDAKPAHQLLLDLIKQCTMTKLFTKPAALA